jgi:hypothetical protein
MCPHRGAATGSHKLSFSLKERSCSDNGRHLQDLIVKITRFMRLSLSPVLPILEQWFSSAGTVIFKPLF